jgi:homoserine O-acetyltransferase/O-succinyltransferase
MVSVKSVTSPAIHLEERSHEADNPTSHVVRFDADRPLKLDCGVDLSPFQIAYQTYGTLNAARSNAILVCHALTGDQHVFNVHPVTGKAGWWETMVGPGRPLDTNKYFIICSNVIGACMGSTGPASTNPATGKVWGLDFPIITIPDVGRAQAMLLDRLGIETLFSVVGGSMGGMQALEWAVMYPRRVASIVPVCACTEATAQQIAWGGLGRRAIRLDPRWRGGDYYDAEPGDGPHEGLALARMVAQVTFRSDEVFTERFGRSLADADTDIADLWQRYEVERYLDYHGDKLVRRFDANSYLLLAKAMDLHDIARGRGSRDAALARIQAPVLALGVWSDILYPSYQQRRMAELVIEAGGQAEYVEIDSPHGHDAFLIDVDQVGDAVAKFLAEVES